MCGKDSPLSLDTAKWLGSPPHVRERLPAPLGPDDEAGITPACAGKTLIARIRSAKIWDHPRMCGKDYWSSHCFICFLGSPPHVRERLILFQSCAAGFGITPACAGKTLSAPPGVIRNGDHPRMCGKDLLFLLLTRDGEGSPPHVRERLVLSSLVTVVFRITPACAGKTLCLHRTAYPAWDHPRMCGKDTIMP